MEATPDQVWKASKENDDPTIKEGFDDLKAAVLTGRTDIVRIILSLAQSYRQEIEDEEDTDEELLSEAEKARRKKKDREYYDLLQFLLDYKDHDGGTCLHYATKLGNVDVVRALLSAGANPNIQNDGGMTPLQCCSNKTLENVYAAELFQAAALSKTFRVNQLLDSGISVNCSDGVESDNKLLHWAVCFSDIDTVRIILDRGADVNAFNGDGMTPLHEAVIRGDGEILIEVLKHDPLLNVVPCKGKFRGKRVLDLADDKPKMKEILLKFDGASDQQSNGKLPIKSKSFSDDSSSQDGNDVMIDMKADQFGNQPCVMGAHGKVTPAQEIVPIPKKAASTSSLFSQTITPKLKYTTRQTTVDSNLEFLMPQPRHICQFKGIGFVLPIKLSVCLPSGDDMIKIQRLWATRKNRFSELGTTIEMSLNVAECSPLQPEKSVLCCFDSHIMTRRHQYRIKIESQKVVIIARDVLGMSCGISTFLQCCQIFRNRTIPLLQIDDWPSVSNRGILLDVKDGFPFGMDVFTSMIKNVCDFKANQIHLPIDMFLPWPYVTSSVQPSCSPRDLLEILDLCCQRGVDVIPYLHCLPPCSESCSKIRSSFQSNLMTLLYRDIFRLFKNSRVLHLDLSLHYCSAKTPDGYSNDCLVTDFLCTVMEACRSHAFTLYLNGNLVEQLQLKLDTIQYGVVFVTGDQVLSQTM